MTVAVSPGTAELVRPDLALFDDPVAAALTLVPDARLTPGDMRLTWPSGSMVRDTRAIAAEVLVAVQAMLPSSAPVPDPVPDRMVVPQPSAPGPLQQRHPVPAPIAAYAPAPALAPTLAL